MEMLQPKTELRQDITGLRAVAVLAVTLYHIAHVLAPDNTLFKGGFLGVDIFFVISGFLMTKIIMTGLDRGNFSLWSFYKRRAKRICPALLVTVIVFVIVALLVLDTDALMKTCRDGIRALGFISNFWLARQTGYFDGAATERIFLHTWSLSVEWQFYLIYPLLLILASNFVSRKALGLLIVALTIISLVFGCVYTLYNPVNSYFLLPSRAYELLIGALAYFYPASYFLTLFKRVDREETLELFRKKLAKQLEIIGLLCILVSLVIVDSSGGWPNAWSLLPLVGTYLCIAADNKQTFLGNVVFQKLGLWSYAIYLVHWPLIVLCGGFSKQDIAWELLPLILVLGLALHYGVERRRSFGWIFLVFYFVIAGSVQWIIKSEGLLFRDVPTVSFPSGNIANDGNAVHIGNPSLPVSFILTGDSFARQYVGVIDTNNQHIIAVTMDDCVSVANYYMQHSNHDKAWHEKCRSRYINLLDVAKNNPNVPVVWGQNWEGFIGILFSDKNGQILKLDVPHIFKADLSNIVDDLSGSNNKLYVLGFPRSGDANTRHDLGKKCYPLHRMNNFLSLLLWDYLDCKDIVSLEEPKSNVLLKSAIRNLNSSKASNNLSHDVSFIDPADAYCIENKCRIMVKDSYEPYFFDGNHLSKYGAEPVIQHVFDLIKNGEDTKP